MMTRAEVEAITNARELLCRLFSRFEITDELAAEIKVAEEGLWNILFPGSARNTTVNASPAKVQR